MFRIVLIFFSLLFFFLLEIPVAKSLTKNKIIEIQEKVYVINSLLKKSRIEGFKLKDQKYKESKIVFNSIKKKEWKKAKKLAKKDKVLEKIIDWHFLNQNNDPKFFSKTNDFIKENPDWPKKVYLRKKMELFIGSNLKNKQIIEFFEKNPPLTTKGAVNYVDALRKENGLENVKNLARKTWINKKFTKRQSKDFYKRYKKF